MKNINLISIPLLTLLIGCGEQTPEKPKHKVDPYFNSSEIESMYVFIHDSDEEIPITNHQHIIEFNELIQPALSTMQKEPFLDSSSDSDVSFIVKIIERELVVEFEMYVLREGHPVFFDARIFHEKEEAEQQPYFCVSRKVELIQLLKKMNLPVDKFREPTTGWRVKTYRELQEN